MKNLLFAAVSAVALIGAAAAADVEFRYDMTLEDGQAYVDQMTRDGWHFRSIDVATTMKGVRYAMIFGRENQPKFMARLDMSPEDYQEATNEALTHNKMRLTDISVADETGGGLTAAIWESTPSNNWLGQTGMSYEQFQQVYADQTKAGLRMTDVDCYRTDGANYYAAIFSKQDGPEWYAFSEMSPSEATSRYDEMLNRKFRPVRITACPGADGPRFSEIFIKDTGESWVAKTGLSEEEFAASAAEADSKGMNLIDFSEYVDAGLDRYAGIWLQQPKQPTQ